MDREENYTAEKNDIEKDDIIKSETVEIAAKSCNMKGFSWGMGISYSLALYILMFAVIIGGELMESTLSYLILNAVLFIIFVVLFVCQLVGAGKAVKNKDIYYCVDGSLFYKYTLIPAISFFIFSSIFIFLIGLGISIVAFILPATIALAPFLMAAAFILPPILLGISFTVSLPGLVLFISMIVITRKQKGMKLGICVLHVLSQLIPVIGLIDLLYITNKYWKRGRVLTILTAVFVCILFITVLVIKRII